MSKKGCVTIVMGKLSSVMRDKIVELNDVEQHYFQDVIIYLRKKCEDSYRQLNRARSIRGEKALGRVVWTEIEIKSTRD